MCGHVNYTWGCGCRGFSQFVNCINFGNGCYGNDGNHEPATESAGPKCYDCTIREQNARITHNSDPYGTVAKQKAREEQKARHKKK
jgi:hypothetical protein